MARLLVFTLSMFWFLAAFSLASDSSLNKDHTAAGVFLLIEGGVYTFNFTAARDACLFLNVTMATRAQMERAVQYGLQTCKFGWISEKVAVVPRLTADQKCGSGKTGVVRWAASEDRRFGVFCFNASAVTLTSTPASPGLTLTTESPPSRELTTTEASGLTSLTSAVHVITPRSDVITPRSDVITPRSDVITPRSDVITPRSDVITTRSDVMTPRSDVITPRSDVITPRSDVITPRSDVITPRSDVITPRSDVITTRSDVITSFPTSQKPFSTHVPMSPSHLVTSSPTLLSDAFSTADHASDISFTSESVTKPTIDSEKSSLRDVPTTLIILGVIAVLLTAAGVVWYYKLNIFTLWCQTQQKDDIETEMWKHTSSEMDLHSLHEEEEEDEESDRKYSSDITLCVNPDTKTNSSE